MEKGPFQLQHDVEAGENFQNSLWGKFVVFLHGSLSSRVHTKLHLLLLLFRSLAVLPLCLVGIDEYYLPSSIRKSLQKARRVSLFAQVVMRFFTHARDCRTLPGIMVYFGHCEHPLIASEGDMFLFDGELRLARQRQFASKASHPFKIPRRQNYAGKKCRDCGVRVQSGD